MENRIWISLLAMFPIVVHSQTPVSMVQIIANPLEALERSGPVSTVGYLVWELELVLFLTDDHASAYDWSSSISVIDDTERAALQELPCFGQYVEIVGTLTLLQPERRVAFSNVESIRWADVSATVCYLRDAVEN